jgi:hypothetical protein
MAWQSCRPPATATACFVRSRSSASVCTGQAGHIHGQALVIESQTLPCFNTGGQAHTVLLRTDLALCELRAKGKRIRRGHSGVEDGCGKQARYHRETGARGRGSGRGTTLVLLGLRCGCCLCMRTETLQKKKKRQQSRDETQSKESGASQASSLTRGGLRAAEVVCAQVIEKQSPERGGAAMGQATHAVCVSPHEGIGKAHVTLVV